MKRASRLAALGAATALLAGCAAPGIDDALQQTNAKAPAFTGGDLRIDRDRAARDDRAARTQAWLSQPLSRDGAVQLALANSPSVHALIAQSEADLATADQAGRPRNPVFNFERLRLGSELEIGRLLSVGLVDLLLWPQRAALSRGQAELTRLRLTGAVVDQVTQVRQAWVRAVAAQQLQQYAVQVQEAAEASADLARRMQAVGNFSRLQRLRQQVFYADATTRLAEAQLANTAAREALIRLLGLDDAQAAQLVLPARLPDLPTAPRAAMDVSAAATAQRIDVQLARAQLDVAGRAQGLDLLPSLADVDLGVRRDTVFDNAAGARGTRRGIELDIRLPLFDGGGARRDALDAQSRAAAYRYDAVSRHASSQLRERYAAYRTAYDIARHQRNELVPLRQAMADENVRRYNGMLIGVFELLADAREQVAGVGRAIEAEQQFWLADAALESAVIGQPHLID